MKIAISPDAVNRPETELDDVRRRFGRFLVVLLWARAAAGHGSLACRAVAARRRRGRAVLALAYHLMWWQQGIARATRYLSAVALVGEPALLLFLMQGHAWQMDMHMYFFAMLALTIAWCDRGAILMAATATALHHLVLLYALPYAVFPGEGNIARVLLHAIIVAFQTAVLVWLSDRLVESVQRVTAMGEEIRAKNLALEERTREAENATRAKSLFLANMSHEIRTPMNAILGFCHLAQRTALNPRQQVYVARIAEAGASLLRLINDILDYSRTRPASCRWRRGRSTCGPRWKARCRCLAPMPKPRASRCAPQSARACRRWWWAMNCALARSCSTCSAMRSSSPRRAW
jgi:signal transduction histidine kinase